MAESTENKRGKKSCLILGVVILALGLFADPLGMGDSVGFGPKQIAAIVVGAALIWMGLKGCKCGGKKKD